MPSQVVCITDAATGASAEVLISQGFNCFSWKAPVQGDTEPTRELLWASENFGSGKGRPSSSGIPLLFPFPGRIAKGEFTFEGKTLKLASLDSSGNALHGFAFDNAWRVVDQQADSVTAEFQPSVDAPQVLDQWTGDYLLRATYTIAGGGLEFTLDVTNVGEGNLPFAFGTHAYFRLPLSANGAPEETLVHAPIDGEWETEGLIPTGKCQPLDDSHPLAGGTALNNAQYDTPFRLSAGEGLQTTTITDPASGRKVVQTFDRSMVSCVVYNPPHREAVCLEPYTNVPDPFALEAAGVDAGLRVLKPGEVYQTKASYELV